MPKQAAVIGLGRFGVSLAQELQAVGFDVLAIDKEERLVQELTGLLTYVVRADSTSESVLRELGVANYDLAVVAIGADIQANIMTTILLKTLGVKQVVSRASNPLHRQTLVRIGADLVVFPEQETGARLAHSLFNPNVQEYMSIARDFGISKLKPPEHLVGHSLEAAGLAGSRDQYGMVVLAIRHGRETILFPTKDHQIAEEDVLFVAGRDESLDKIRRAPVVRQGRSG